MDNPLLDLYRALPHELSMRRQLEQYRMGLVDREVDLEQVYATLDRFGILRPPPVFPFVRRRFDLGFLLYWVRKQVVYRYSFAVPSEKAIRLLVESSPLVEIGAHNGYWAHLVRAAGGDVLAYDLEPPMLPRSAGVLCGGAEKAGPLSRANAVSLLATL